MKNFIVAIIFILFSFVYGVNTFAQNPSQKGFYLDFDISAGYAGTFSRTKVSQDQNYFLKAQSACDIRLVLDYKFIEECSVGIGSGLTMCFLEEETNDMNADRHCLAIPIFARFGITAPLNSKLNGILNVAPGINLNITEMCQNSFCCNAQIGILVENFKCGLNLNFFKPDFSLKERGFSGLYASCVGLFLGMRFSL